MSRFLGTIYKTALAASALFAFSRLYLHLRQDTSRPSRQAESAAARKLKLRLQASEHEQRRLAFDLHDRVGQNLTILGLNLRLARQDMERGSLSQAAVLVDESLALIEETGRQVREVIGGLSPVEPVFDGLLPALHSLCDRLVRGREMRVQIIGEEFSPRLPSPVETAFYSIAQEALHNVVRHSGASQVQVELFRAGRQRGLRVSDNGSGFILPPGFNTSVESDFPLGSNPAGLPEVSAHLGLQSLRYRAALVDGRLDVQSAPGQGTVVTVTVESDEP